MSAPTAVATDTARPASLLVWRLLSLLYDFFPALALWMLVGALFVSDRYWVLNNRPIAVEVGTVKIPSEMGHPEWLVSYSGVHFPPAQKSKLALGIEALNRSRGIWPRVTPGVPAPKFGYSVREIGFLGMPFGYYTELGWSLYTESPYETVVLPLNEEGLEIGRAHV